MILQISTGGIILYDIGKGNTNTASFNLGDGLFHWVVVTFNADPGVNVYIDGTGPLYGSNASVQTGTNVVNLSIPAGMVFDDFLITNTFGNIATPTAAYVRDASTIGLFAFENNGAQS
jgi:hypothetical protein